MFAPSSAVDCSLLPVKGHFETHTRLDPDDHIYVYNCDADALRTIFDTQHQIID